MAVLAVSAFGLMISGTLSTALAQTAPDALVASPDIYKVIAENVQYRVIEANWQPGQRDVMHSRPASVVYFPMDCVMRYHFPSGANSNYVLKAGAAHILGMPLDAYVVENTGTSACKMIMFHAK